MSTYGHLFSGRFTVYTRAKRTGLIAVNAIFDTIGNGLVFDDFGRIRYQA